MRTHSPIASTLFDAFDQLLGSDVLSIDFKKFGSFISPGDDAREVVRQMNRQWDDVVLGPELDNATPWISELGCRWRSRAGVPEIHGEFRVSCLYEALLTTRAPRVWDGADDEEKRLAADLRTIDWTPRSGVGVATYIRMQPRVDPLEIWYYDLDLMRYSGHAWGFVRLDLDYAGYMKVLPVTKGTLGWQYLFADIDVPRLSERTVTNLERMLEVFPTAFPEHDYAPLRERLDARRRSVPS